MNTKYEMYIRAEGVGNYGFDINFDNNKISVNYTPCKAVELTDHEYIENKNITYSDKLFFINGVHVKCYSIDGERFIPVQRTCESYVPNNGKLKNWNIR